MEATMTKETMFTIGHSTHSIEKFLGLLKKHSISVIADVRSSPFSRYNPQYNRPSLSEELKANGIRYVFLGRELGARSDNPTCYQSGKVVYSRLAKTPEFREGLHRLLRGVEDHRIALMCAEKEPLNCHRTVLVAQALSKLGIAVRHILADGSLETHADALQRLVVEHGINQKDQRDMFRSEEEAISEALELQEARIAYRDDSQNPTTSSANQ